MPASQSSASFDTGQRGRRKLLSRPADFCYFIFFVFHIINFLCMDGQSFWPTALVPKSLQKVKQNYLQDSQDPFLIAFDSRDVHYQWFSVSVYSSLLIQNPVFVAGVWMLWRDDKRIYPIMASYGLLAATTTMQCLASVLYGSEASQLSRANVSFLVKAYSAFVVIPFVIFIDMTIRSVRLIQQGASCDDIIRAKTQ